MSRATSRAGQKMSTRADRADYRATAAGAAADEITRAVRLTRASRAQGCPPDPLESAFRNAGKTGAGTEGEIYMPPFCQHAPFRNLLLRGRGAASFEAVA